MKKIVFIFAMLFSVSVHAKTLTAENVSVWVPDSWESMNGQGTLIMAISEDQTANININKDNIGSYSVSDYKKASMDMIKEVLKVNVIKSKDNYWIYEINAEGLKIKQIQYFFVKNNIGYVLTCTASAEHFDKNMSSFQKSADSLTIK